MQYFDSVHCLLSSWWEELLLLLLLLGAARAVPTSSSSNVPMAANNGDDRIVFSCVDVLGRHNGKMRRKGGERIFSLSQRARRNCKTRQPTKLDGSVLSLNLDIGQHI